MSPNYAALGQTPEETALLIEHDRDEELHAFELAGPFDYGICAECGDTEEGLMHNNTWRNVEPLLTETVQVTLEITYRPNFHDHPDVWDWAGLLDVDLADVKVVK